MASRRRMLLIVMGVILTVSGIFIGGRVSDWSSTFARKDFRVDGASGVASISRSGTTVYARYEIHKGNGQTVWQQDLGKFERRNSAVIQVDQSGDEITFHYGEETVKASLTPRR